jgi:DNA-binding transcriptional MerR regulator
MIGKVASLYDITVQTLRHYDKIGLFRPEVINPETGYRYYSVLQLRQLEYILFLRQLHFSLPEIQDAMDQLRNGSDLMDILNQRDQALSQEIAEIQERRDSIHRLLQIQESAPEPLDRIQIKELSPPRHFLLHTIAPLNVQDAEFSLKLLEHRKALLGTIPPIQTNYSFGSTVSLSQFRQSGDLCYTGILLDPGLYGSAPPPGLIESPCGYYAAIRFCRDTTRPETAYAALSTFLQDHHFHAQDTILEFGVDPSFSSISRISDLTELQIHIELT